VGDIVHLNFRRARLIFESNVDDLVRRVVHSEPPMCLMGFDIDDKLD